MLARLGNEFERLLVVTSLGWELNLQHRIIEVLLIGVLLQLLCELLEAFPVLQVPSGVRRNWGHRSDLVSYIRFLFVIELCVEAFPNLGNQVRQIAPTHQLRVTFDTFILKFYLIFGRDVGLPDDSQ